MPCHVRCASPSRKRRIPSLPLSLFHVLAKLDMNNQVEREVRDIIARVHTGRWPLLRAYSMRRIGSAVYEVAKWRRCRGPAVYSVLTWSLAAISLSWRYVPTLVAAREAFAAVAGNVPTNHVAAPAAASAKQ